MWCYQIATALYDGGHVVNGVFIGSLFVDDSQSLCELVCEPSL